MSQWLPLFTALGIGSIVTVLLQGLFGKRKLSAEATKIITDAASGVVAIQKDELSRVIASNVALTARVEASERERASDREVIRELTELVAVHGVWDRQAFTMLREQGIEMPPPPPLHMTTRSES